MRSLAQLLATFVAALFAGMAGAVPILPFALGIQEIVIFPLSLAVGAILAALAARWVAALFVPDGLPTPRLLPVLVASEVGAVVGAFVVLYLYFSPPRFLASNVSLLVVGVVVVALAATAAAWSLRGPGSRRSGRAVFAAGLLLLAGTTATVALPANERLRCTAGEKAALGEFPQYADVRVYESHDGMCMAYYGTPDPAEQVRAYFSERFEESGWTVDASVASGPSKVGEAPTGGPLIAATRGVYRYEVYYSSPRQGTSGPGTDVAVGVWRD